MKSLENGVNYNTSCFKVSVAPPDSTGHKKKNAVLKNCTVQLLILPTSSTKVACVEVDKVDLLEA